MASDFLISQLESRIKALEEKNEQQVQNEKSIQQQLDKLRSNLFTHELATGVQFIDVLRSLNVLKPGLLSALLEDTKKAQEKLPETKAKNDHHTIDAFKRVAATLETALKKA